MTHNHKWFLQTQKNELVLIMLLHVTFTINQLITLKLCGSPLLFPFDFESISALFTNIFSACLCV